LFIEEAPGISEDATGLPFIGRSGKLLDRLLSDVAERTHVPEYAITNVVACIPRDLEKFFLEDNKVRAPTKPEIDACSHRLLEFIKLCKPKQIVLIGKIAGKTKSLEKLKLPTLTITHPAYMLRKGGHTSLEYRRALLMLVEFLKG